MRRASFVVCRFASPTLEPAFALTVPVQFVAGWPFLRGAAQRARVVSANMDTLIASGTLTAFFYSTFELFTGGHLYFDTAAMITAFLLVGRYFEARSTSRASQAISTLLEMGAKQARLLRRRHRRRTQGPAAHDHPTGVEHLEGLAQSTSRHAGAVDRHRPCAGLRQRPVRLLHPTRWLLRGRRRDAGPAPR